MLLNALIIIVIAAYLIETLLDYLNQSTARNPLDPKIANLYDAKERERSIQYSAVKTRFAFYSSSFSAAIMIIALGFGWFASLDTWVRDRFDNQIVISLAFIAALSVISWVLNLPFQLYSTFGIEARYGFNKVTPKTFVTDTIKGALLTIVLAGGLLTAILWLYQELGSNFWIYAWAVVATFSLLMFMFGTTLILPLFNKLKPLASGELRDEIEKYCQSQGYSLGRLFVMDGSKRSTKANAFFSGMGKSKTIVLFDTLIEKLTKEEIVAVLAHEIGHYKRKHTLAMFIVSNLQTLAIFGLLGWALQYPEFSKALGAEEGKFHLSALAFFLLLTPLQILLGLLNNSLSRRNEFDADTFAAKTYKQAPMRSALSKISTDSLANLNPHPLYVAFNYTHPPLVQRLKNVG